MNALFETLKTSLLFAALTAILISVGYFVGGFRGAAVFLVISVITNFIAFWFSDKLAIWSAGGQEVSEQQFPTLYSDVAELSHKLNLPMPKVFVSPQLQPNAFATGRSPRSSAVCLNQGLLQMLSREQVRAVIAHELGHIKNRDVLTATIAAVIAGAISSVVNIALYWGGGDRDSRDINPVAALMLLILSPLAATLIQLSISRSREYAADRVAAEVTGAPQDLVDALVRIHEGVQHINTDINPAFSSLYIVKPFAGNALFELFSTHPALEKRIARLQSMS